MPKSLSHFAVIALAVALAAFAIFADGSYQRLGGLRSDLESLHQRNQQTEKEVRELRYRVHALQHDDRYLERVAREELSLARKGEKIFIFEEKP